MTQGPGESGGTSQRTPETGAGNGRRSQASPSTKKSMPPSRTVTRQRPMSVSLRPSEAVAEQTNETSARGAGQYTKVAGAETARQGGPQPAVTTTRAGSQRIMRVTTRTNAVTIAGSSRARSPPRVVPPLRRCSALAVESNRGRRSIAKSSPCTPASVRPSTVSRCRGCASQKALRPRLTSPVAWWAGAAGAGCWGLRRAARPTPASCRAPSGLRAAAAPSGRARVSWPREPSCRRAATRVAR